MLFMMNVLDFICFPAICEETFSEHPVYLIGLECVLMAIVCICGLCSFLFRDAGFIMLDNQ